MGGVAPAAWAGNPRRLQSASPHGSTKNPGGRGRKDQLRTVMQEMSALTNILQTASA